MNELHLFAGAGGGILGGMLLGHTTVCAVEIEPYCRKVLLQRQRDGILPKFPIWDDVQTFDGTPWRGKVDVVCGGFPCQDISAAGKGEGINGARSGLWSEFSRIIGEIRPGFVFVENSPLLVSRGLDRVLCDLAALGYDATWGVVGAHHAGAPHKRERLWIYSYANGIRLETHNNKDQLRDQTYKKRNSGRSFKMGSEAIWPKPYPSGAKPMGIYDGMADDVGRIKAAGNGQVPAVAALAWRILSQS